MNKVAVAFISNVLKQNPGAKSFETIYDAMSRAACRRSFHNLGYEELALTGISFSLLNTPQLEQLITQVQQSITLEDVEDS